MSARPAQPVRSAVWLAFAAGFISLAHRSGFGVLYPSMVADQGWSVGEVTGAYSVAMLIYSPATVLSGQLLDRLGVRATMLFGTLVLGIGLAGVGLARDLWQVYALYAVAIGLGSPAVGFVPMLKLLSLRASSRLGWALGLFNVGQGVGALISSPALQIIVDGFDWRAGFGTLGMAALLVLLPLVLCGAPGRAENPTVHRAAPTGPPTRLWQQRTFWLMVLGNATVGYLLLLPAHQVAHLVLVGLPNVVAATAGGLMGACIGVGALLGGWAIDRWGAGRLGLAGALLLAIGVAALISTVPASFWLAAIYVLAGGIGRGIIGVNLATVQARAFAGPALGRVSGLLDLGFGFGAFAGPYLTALSRDLTGSYNAGLATALLAGLLAAVCTLIVGTVVEKPTPAALQEP